MNDYIPRVIESLTNKYLKRFSVVGLTGPRQSGKSTVLAKSLPDYTYVTFDDDRTRQFFLSDPYGFMQMYQKKVIFDEVQKVPEIFEHIKMAVDKDRNDRGKYILTGSSQFYFFKNITESLAGRIGLLTLLPFQFSEVPMQHQEQSVYSGSYPELSQTNYEHWEYWYSSYLESYIQKDVRAFAKILDLRDFRRFLQLLAAQTSQILNMSTYAKEIGVDVKTIKSWLSILEASYIIFLLPPYHKNYGKRIVKSPKVYFYDTGLVSYLTGINSQSTFRNGPMAGSIFENYVICEILKKELHNKKMSELFYLRTSNGVEVDLIVDRKMHKALFEIKLTSTFKPKMVHALKEFSQKSDSAYLLYTGEKFSFPDVSIINYQEYLSN
jgi:predicted AAA+ superfamily ATPase